MTDPVTITTLIIAAIPSTIASLVSAFVVFKSATIAKETKTIAKSTHDLVDGSMLIQLKLHANTARLLAISDRTPENIATADLAEKMLLEHKVKLLTIEGSMDQDLGKTS